MSDLHPCQFCGATPCFSNGKVDGYFLLACGCGNQERMIGSSTEQGGSIGVDRDLAQMWNHHNPAGTAAGNTIRLEGIGPHWLPALQSAKVHDNGDNLILDFVVLHNGSPVTVKAQVGFKAADRLLQELAPALARLVKNTGR